MNTGNPTAIPHDDSKALSAEERAKFNEKFARVQAAEREGLVTTLALVQVLLP